MASYFFFEKLKLMHGDVSVSIACNLPRLPALGAKITLNKALTKF